MNVNLMQRRAIEDELDEMGGMERLRAVYPHTARVVAAALGHKHPIWRDATTEAKWWAQLVWSGDVLGPFPDQETAAEMIEAAAAAMAEVGEG